MVLKLYGNSDSPNARLVAAILLEKEVPYELVDLDWNVTKSPNYLHLQPFGQMPCIVSETNPSFKLSILPHHEYHIHISISMFCIG